MPVERQGLLEVGGNAVTVIGRDMRVGQAAPEFHVTAQDWSIFHGIEDTLGKVRIIASVPSLDSSVCDRETRRFNQEASALDEDVVVLVISMDLPYAQRRWCGAAGVDRVTILSDHREASFGEKYGVLIKDLRVLRRAVFVIDRDGVVVYADYMPSFGDEPDYEAVLAAAKQVL